MDYRVDFYEARWHLDVARRMLASYDEYAGKRFLVGVVREGAKCAGRIVRAFLIREGARGDLKTFLRNVGPKYLSEGEISKLVLILNIERDQRRARVEFDKGSEILMEVDGGWKVLRVSRLREILDSLEGILVKFGKN